MPQGVWVTSYKKNSTQKQEVKGPHHFAITVGFLDFF